MMSRGLTVVSSGLHPPHPAFESRSGTRRAIRESLVAARPRWINRNINSKMTLCKGNDLLPQLEVRAAFHICDGNASAGAVEAPQPLPKRSYSIIAVGGLEIRLARSQVSTKFDKG